MLAGLVEEKFVAAGLKYSDCVKSERLIYADFMQPGVDFDARSYQAGGVQVQPSGCFGVSIV